MSYHGYTGHGYGPAGRERDDLQQDYVDISGRYERTGHFAKTRVIELTQHGCHGRSSEDWSYTVAGNVVTMNLFGLKATINGTSGSYVLPWSNGITYRQLPNHSNPEPMPCRPADALISPDLPQPQTTGPRIGAPCSNPDPLLCPPVARLISPDLRQPQTTDPRQPQTTDPRIAAPFSNPDPLPRRPVHPLISPDLGKVQTTDPRTGAPLPIVAFYFPGREEPCDRLCRASFLGNFFELENPIPIHPKGVRDSVLFTNAEAAFQALKFWQFATDFASLSGDQAFTKKKQLQGREDWTYAGYGSNWDAMNHVLHQKFKPGSKCADDLLRTEDAFLLEHNSVTGRDSTWSDNMIGDGRNWLGLQLMLIRDELFGKRHGTWTTYLQEHVDLRTGTFRSNEWQIMVSQACMAVRQKLGSVGATGAATGAATSGLGRHAGQRVPHCGCGKPTFNGRWDETCSRSCPGPRIPDPNTATGGAPHCGCGKPTWNGQWNETCSRSCRGPKVADPSSSSSWFPGVSDLLSWGGSGSAATSSASANLLGTDNKRALQGSASAAPPGRAICGCGKPTWNGQWNETCTRSCPGPKLSPSSFSS
eukprot:TRINITY_DN4002_c0_g3_i1.p1 TRINITY_DN4002_c0_g3~~TRINITY_DN4002_c0_g3_i1.p1  ORF type:complete len:614 (-),score=44.20 TRINITY_DN4002_c0_g3_i1:2-1771(-)